MITRDEIIEKINNGKYEPKMTMPKKFPYKENEILDEDLTVAQNKALVKELKEKYKAEMLKYRQSEKDAEKSFENDVIDFIATSSYKLNKEQVSIMIDFINDRCSFDYKTEFLDELESMCLMYADLKSLENE